MTKYPSHKYLFVENSMKGPKNDRSLTNRGFIEFQSEFQAKAFLDHVGKGSKVKLSTGVDVAFKAEVTKIN